MAIAGVAAGQPILQTPGPFERLERRFWRGRVPPSDPALVRAVRPLMPEIVRYLQMREPSSAQAGLRRYAPAVAHRARSEPRGRALPLLLAADRLAGSIHFYWAEAPREWLRDGAPARLGELEFDSNEIAGGWLYTHNLLREVAEEHADTIWGERAFVQLAYRGWVRGPGCPAPQSFDLVIERVPRFLEAHPRTPFRRDLLLTLAVAYETLWSLTLYSGAHETDIRQPDERREEGRTNAIRHYEQLRREWPVSEEARYAAHKLESLRALTDTKQRLLWCVWD